MDLYDELAFQKGTIIYITLTDKKLEELRGNEDDLCDFFKKRAYKRLKFISLIINFNGIDKTILYQIIRGGRSNCRKSTK